MRKTALVAVFSTLFSASGALSADAVTKPKGMSSAHQVPPVQKGGPEILVCPIRYKECKGSGFSSNVTICCRSTDTCTTGESGYPFCKF